MNTFIINTTTRCNFQCPHCIRIPVDGAKTIMTDVPVSVFEEALREGRKINYGHVSLTGGEPILHQDFRTLIRLAVEYGYGYNIVSNAFLYSKYWEIIRDYKNGCTQIAFSLDGATAEAHDRVRAKPGSYEKVIAAIKFFVEQKVPVWVHMCITRHNRHQIEELAALCASLKVSVVKYMGVDLVLGRQAYSLTGEERSGSLARVEKLRDAYRGQMAILAADSLLLSHPKNIHFSRALDLTTLYIDHEGGMLFSCDIYKPCPDRPSILRDGFWGAVELTIDVVAELKKQRMRDLAANASFEGFDTHDYYSHCIEAAITAARERRAQPVRIHDRHHASRPASWLQRWYVARIAGQ